MKKFFLLGIAVLVISAFCLSACADNQVTHYNLNISFVVEPDSGYIGSYSTRRCDLNNPSICWGEWGEWVSGLELALDPNKKICFGNEATTLRARSDYQWFQDGNCFQLEKKN